MIIKQGDIDRKLTAKEFMIKGYPHIFEDKIDFKDLFMSWGYKPPDRITKQKKYDLLILTRNKHLKNSLNYKFWDYHASKFKPASTRQIQLGGINV